MHHNNLGIEQDCDWGVPIPDGSKPSGAIDQQQQQTSSFNVVALQMDRKEEQFMDMQTELLTVE